MAASWLLAGLFALFRMFALILVLPIVFYQGAIGGTQAPVAAAPKWLRNIAEAIPFDAVGEIYRGAIIVGTGDFPATTILLTAGIGLLLIWLGSLMSGQQKNMGA